MRLGKTKKYFFHNSFFIVTLFVFFISVLIGIIFRNMYHPFENAVSAYASETANNCINTAVKNCISDKIEYSDIIILKENKTGEIVSLTADALKITALKTELINEIEKNISLCSKNKIILNIGDAQSNPIFSALGPSFPVKIVPDVIIHADFRDSFENKGINNIRHTVYIDTEMIFTISSSLYRKTFNVSNSLMIADTVITGSVPDYYGVFADKYKSINQN